MAFDPGGLLKQYMGGGAVPADNAADHFGQAAQTAPSEPVRQGLAQAFRSGQTPPFGEMVGQLFANANPQQQAGMLTQLLGSLSPAAIAALTNSGALPTKPCISTPPSSSSRRSATCRATATPGPGRRGRSCPRVRGRRTAVHRAERRPDVQVLAGRFVFREMHAQDEVDGFWTRQSAGGHINQCGWLQDKDPPKSTREMQAMMKMTMLDFAGLQRACKQRPW